MSICKVSKISNAQFLERLTSFIKESNTHVHWEGEKLSIWIHVLDLFLFTRLLEIHRDKTSADVYKCFIEFDLVPICKRAGVDPEQVLPRIKEIKK